MYKRQALEQLRRTHSGCASRQALVEREAEKEQAARRAEIKAAQEARTKAERKLHALEARIGARELAAMAPYGDADG